MFGALSCLPQFFSVYRANDKWARSEICEFLVYEIDPARFAVEAYRHFTKIEDGPNFIQKLLQGEVRLRDQSY